MKSLGFEIEMMLSGAHVLLEDGNTKLALSLLQRIAHDKPKLIGAQALLGQALLETGDRKGALAAFRKGQDLIDADKTVRTIWQGTITRGLKELGQSDPPKKGG